MTSLRGLLEQWLGELELNLSISVAITRIADEFTDAGAEGERTQRMLYNSNRSWVFTLGSLAARVALVLAWACSWWEDKLFSVAIVNGLCSGFFFGHWQLYSLIAFIAIVLAFKSISSSFYRGSVPL